MQVVNISRASQEGENENNYLLQQDDGPDPDDEEPHPDEYIEYTCALTVNHLQQAREHKWMILLAFSTVLAWIWVTVTKSALIWTVNKEKTWVRTDWRLYATCGEIYLCFSGFIMWFYMTKKTDKHQPRRHRIMPNADKMILLVGVIGVFLSAVMYTWHHKWSWAAKMYIYGAFLLVPSALEFGDYRRYRDPYEIKCVYRMFAVTLLVLLMSFVLEIILIPHGIVDAIRDLAKQNKYGSWLFLLCVGCRPFFCFILWRMIVQAFELPTAFSEAHEKYESLRRSRKSDFRAHNFHERDVNLRDSETGGRLTCIRAFDIFTSIVAFIVTFAYYMFTKTFGLEFHILLLVAESVMLGWFGSLCYRTWRQPFLKRPPLSMFILVAATIVFAGLDIWYQHDLHSHSKRKLVMRAEWEWMSNIVSLSMFYIVGSIDITHVTFKLEEVGRRSYSMYLNVVYVFNLLLLQRELLTLIFMTRRFYRKGYKGNFIIHVLFFWVVLPAAFHFEMMKMAVLTKEVLRQKKADRLPLKRSPDIQQMIEYEVSERYPLFWGHGRGSVE